MTIPQLRNPRFMRHFDLTMTYKRSSDLWCNYLPAVAWPSGIGQRLRWPPQVRRTWTAKGPGLV
jgi:hypothetical protein